MHPAAVFLVVILSMGEGPDREVLRDSVDVVELNHFYDDEGKPVFDQLIFYRWEPAGFHRLIDYRLVKSRECLPQRQQHGWFSLWWDEGELRRVDAASYRETWTQYDPELVDRENHPKGSRPGLRKRVPVRLHDFQPGVRLPP